MIGGGVWGAGCICWFLMGWLIAIDGGWDDVVLVWWEGGLRVPLPSILTSFLSLSFLFTGAPMDGTGLRGGVINSMVFGG